MIHCTLRFALPGSIALATALNLTPLTANAQEVNELNPSDLVPRYFTVSRFSDLDANALYDVNLALRRGRTIQIEGCTPSQSRAIFRASLENRAPAVDLVQSTCGG